MKKHKYLGEVNGQKHFEYTTEKGKKLIVIQLANGKFITKK